MIVSKEHINLYIECPHKFGKYVLNDRWHDISVMKDSVKQFKNYIVEIASYEMKENIKLELSEYRTRFTNKYFTNKKSISSIMDPEILVTKLNNFFSIFASNVFIGYNMPIDISIAGTNIIYRDVIDFGMIDEEQNLTFIELIDFSSSINIKDKIKYWAHYYTPYSFLASSFDKDVRIVLMDPDINDSLEMKMVASRFDDDYQQLCNLISPIKNSYLFKNLYNCHQCDFVTTCK